jgi:V8-like Glu-specific endopeptidase
MPTPGHLTVRNTDGIGRTAPMILESAGLRQKSKPSLPYYQRPRRREVVLNEAFVADSGPGNVGDALPDVAIASMGDATFLEAIIGNDDRVRVSDDRMAMNPWRQICSLRIRSATSRTYVGTAWFIHPRVLATAGHCVYLQDDGGWAESISIAAARSGDREPFGRVVSKRFLSVDGWVKERKRDFDYGVIILDDESVGQQVGNFEVQSLTPGELRGLDAQISGYPADRDSAKYQYFHMRPLMDVTDQRLMYEIDTFGGQSGSPIWQETEEAGVIAIGIHTTGGVSSNSGTRINDDVIGNFIQWTAEAGNA